MYLAVTSVQRMNSFGLQMIVPDVAHCASHYQPAAVATTFATAASGSGVQSV